MKTFITLFAFISIAFFSCKETPKKKAPDKETPKALQDKSSGIEITTKRGYDDLVQSLYAELVDKKPELKEFETTLSNLKDEKSDSLNVFNQYNQKSKSYYAAATNHFEKIKDSVLRNKMKCLINKSMDAYKVKTGIHEEFVSAIDSRNLTLNDLHNVLQLVKTLPLIEKYQHDNITPSQSLAVIKNKLSKTIEMADSLINN